MKDNYELLAEAVERLGERGLLAPPDQECYQAMKAAAMISKWFSNIVLASGVKVYTETFEGIEKVVRIGVK